MPSTVDKARNAVSRIVIGYRWQITAWQLETDTQDTLLLLHRWVGGVEEKCKLRLEYAEPLEDTLKRIAVHLKLKS